MRSLGAWTCIAAIASAGGRGGVAAPPSVVSLMRRMIAAPAPLTFHKQMKGKVWVLDTETKGTGAQMVPLESTLKQPQPKEHLLDPKMRRQKPEPDARPPAPRRFKVVDVSTRQVLADDADARMTLELLGRSSAPAWTSTSTSGSPGRSAGGCSPSPSGSCSGSGDRTARARHRERQRHADVPARRADAQLDLAGVDLALAARPL